MRAAALRRWQELTGWFPASVLLSPEAFGARHRALRFGLWALIGALAVVMIVGRRPTAVGVWTISSALLASLCDAVVRWPRARSIILVCAAAAVAEGLVAQLPGRAEADMVLPAVFFAAAAYQSWPPVMAALGFVAMHQIFVSDDPLGMSLGKGALCIVVVIVQRSMLNSLQVNSLNSLEAQGAVLAAEERQLRVRAELADRQYEAVRSELADLMLRADISAELEQMVAELAAGGGSVARNAERAQQVMNDFMQTIVNIEYAMLESETTWSVAHEQTALTEGTMERLASASEDIVEIAEEIERIARKTRLLSLNATIESAKAGEAGVGFAVVADEVRALAGQVGTATHRITQVVEGIQSGAAAAQDALGQINGVLDKARESQQAIAEAVELQTLAARQAGDAIAGLHADAQHMGNAPAGIGGGRPAGEWGSSPPRVEERVGVAVAGGEPAAAVEASTLADEHPVATSDADDLFAEVWL